MATATTCDGPPVLPDENPRQWRKRAGRAYGQVALLIAGCGPALGGTGAPLQFYEAALHALMADAEESVVLLATPSMLTSGVVRALSQRPNIQLLRTDEEPELAHFAALSADYLVVESPLLIHGRGEQRTRSGFPYHAVWTWCGSTCASASVEESLLVSASKASHLIVEARHDPAEPVRGRNALLQVRSTISPSWLALPRTSHLFNASWASLDLPRGMWSRRDVCIGYGNSTPILPSIHNNVIDKSLYAERRMVIMQAAPGVSGPEGTDGPPQLLWPLRWPRHYHEGNPTPFKSQHDAQDAAYMDAVRLAMPTTPTSRRRPVLGTLDPMTTVSRQHAALVVELSMDNLFHVLFPALPLSEDLAALRGQLVREQQMQHQQTQQHPRKRQEQHMQAETQPTPRVVTALANLELEWLPRYTVLWPGSAPGLGGWAGWELVMRAVASSLGMAPPPAERTQELLTPLRLGCHPLVVGGHSSFWPLFNSAAELLAARPRVLALRRALLRSFRGIVGAAGAALPPSQSSGSIVFTTRPGSGVRTITNMAEVRAALEADASLAGRVSFVAMGELPLMEQLGAVQRADVLVGPHGQAMVWVAMLPSEQGRRACLEIFPQQMVIQQTHAWWDYRRWAFMNEVEYFLLTQPNAASCHNLDFRRCGNFTILLPQFMTALRRVVEHVAPAAIASVAPPEGREPRTTHTPPLHRMSWGHAKATWPIEGVVTSLDCVTDPCAKPCARPPEELPRVCALRWMCQTPVV